MDNNCIDVEVAFAKANEQAAIAVSIEKDSSINEAINKSGILQQFPEIDLTKMAVGIFGKVCPLDKKPAPGDRIEIYRPLFQNPMEARRNRVVKPVS